MKFGDIKDFIEFLIIVLVGLTPLFGLQDNESIVKTIAILAVVIAVIIYGLRRLYKMLKQQKRDEQSMSNLNVIKKSRHHCKSLYRYAEASRKKLLCNPYYREIKQDREQESKLLSRMVGKDPSAHEKEKLYQRIDALKKQYSDRNTISLIKNLDAEQDYKVAKLISDTFIRLERVLLNAEQFDLRVEFGKYIIDFSEKESDRQRASIDFLGWTYMMMGETKKGVAAILTGIERAEYSIKQTQNPETIESSLYNITRAYRHLGSARPIYEKTPEKAIEYLNKGLDSFKQLRISKLSEETKEKYLEMEIGLKYGLIVASYYEFINKFNDNKQTDRDYEKLEHAFMNIDSLKGIAQTFKNKHRYVKFEIIKSKYLELLYDHKDQFQPFSKHAFDIDKDTIKTELNDCLTRVESIFWKNIFMDEAVEHYLEESVKLLQYNLVDLLKEDVQ